MSFPLLSLITFLPAAGALLLALLVPRERAGTLKWCALAIVLADLVLALALAGGFYVDRSGFQFTESAEWMPSLGIGYRMGVDGISLLMVLLTAFLGVVAVLSSWNSIRERLKEYLAALLLLQAAMLGVFLALDVVLFYVFWEVMLIPMALLIGVWGGEKRVYAAVKFFLYTLAGSLFMLLGFLAVYFAHHAATGAYTFDIAVLLSANLPAQVQAWAFWALFLGFAIKVPMFPFHTWLPDAHVEAPTAGSVILAGVLLKMGTYGFLRFSLPMLPDASLAAAPYVAGLAVVGIIYGALVAWMQTDIKKLVAYSSVSHLGFVMLGIFSFTSQGLAGGVAQMVNHGLSTGALFLLVGVLYERRHTREIAQFGGLAGVMPLFTAVFGIITFSSIGLPGLNGFVGEFLVLLGAFSAGMWTLGALAATGVVLGAVYMLTMFRDVMLGEVRVAENRALPDLSRRELLFLLPIVLLVIALGIFPQPMLEAVKPPLARITARLETARIQQNRFEEALVREVPEAAAALSRSGGGS
jgi:NADH-quinone oxidoreductase subunit M